MCGCDDNQEDGVDRMKLLWDLLWEEGYCPQMEVYALEETFELDSDALLKRYEHCFQDRGDVGRARVREILQARSENGLIRSDVRILKGTLYWDIRVKRHYR